MPYKFCNFVLICSVFSGLLGKILMTIRDAGFEISAMQMVGSLQESLTY